MSDISLLRDLGIAPMRALPPAFQLLAPYSISVVDGEILVDFHSSSEDEPPNEGIEQ